VKKPAAKPAFSLAGLACATTTTTVVAAAIIAPTAVAANAVEAD
jgi:hypothetical protein